MPRLTVLTVVFALVLALDGQPALATHSQAGEAGLAVGAAAANLLYLPAKTLVAIGGLGVGALTGLLTGGDIRAAYAVWVPAAGGTFMLTPAHFEGTRPTGRRPTPATPRSCTAPSTCTKRPTRDTSRVGTGRESGTLGDPRAPHVAAGESRRDRRGTARPAHASVAMPVQHAEGWRLHRCGGIRRSSDAPTRDMSLGSRG